ncbi:MAG TPA: ABC transporter ATP-binding protein [Chloroflexota bacterium]|nr:ABC transporter ATP-binding protein [Chloroflexota bacterium]
MTANGRVLAAHDLAVSYSPRRSGPLVLDGVSFDIRRGEKFVFLGPSGCGKSTLLKTVAGFLRPVRGSLLLNDQPIKGPGPDRAVVFQEFDQLLPWRTVLGNVSYSLQVTGKARGTDAVKRALDFIELVGLRQATHHFPHQLSGGMKQRTAIARALSLEPDILLMDEPFGSLDQLTRARMQEELETLWRKTGVTILFVTHSIQEAIVLGQRVMVLGQRPARIVGTLDTSDIDGREHPGFGAVYAQLRDLLLAGHGDSQSAAIN